MLKIKVKYESDKTGLWISHFLEISMTSREQLWLSLIVMGTVGPDLVLG